MLPVDLPPIADLRSRLLPPSPRLSVCAQSALDYSWTKRVDPIGGVFITAEGLLMYLEPEQALVFGLAHQVEPPSRRADFPVRRRRCRSVCQSPRRRT
jgi:O-methyltransferase involved in polyketide biosynthesis